MNNFVLGAAEDTVVGRMGTGGVSPPALRMFFYNMPSNTHFLAIFVLFPTI